MENQPIFVLTVLATLPLRTASQGESSIFIEFLKKNNPFLFHQCCVKGGFLFIPNTLFYDLFERSFYN